MKAVVQRVIDAEVHVEGRSTGRIERGLLVYLGVETGDTPSDLAYMARKIAGLRIFTDGEGKMNLSVSQSGGSVLLISQFTLCADTKKGNRPSFNRAMDPAEAVGVYREMKQLLEEDYALQVETGSFGDHMDVSYTNDGPVTILLDSR